MSRIRKIAIVAALVVTVILFASYHFANRRVSKAATNAMPPVMLWAWERPENLEFIDTERFGVAFLAQTLVLEKDRVVVRKRRQRLDVAPTTYLIAVTRIEPDRTADRKASFSDSQRAELTSLISGTLQLPNVSAVQVDFDVARSEREFYRSLLQDVRSRLPEETPLSITALASFCFGDRWLKDLPVNEVVPMIFRMGTDSQKIKTLLADGNDFREPMCRDTYGIAIDEPLNVQFEPGRRIYVFNTRPWNPQNLALFGQSIEQ